MLKKLRITNYKSFEQFDLDFNDNLNILVGRNEVGKSTVLEAINLALTKRLNGRQLEYELSPHLFNKKVVSEYIASLKATPIALPSITIELFLGDRPEYAFLRGTMNSLKEDACGVKIEICFDDDYAQEYQSLLAANKADIKTIPVEYYKVHWFSFANNAITSRGFPIQPSYIDTTTIRLQSGADYYLQEIIRADLDPKERAALSLAYRALKETFSEEVAIKGINNTLASKKGAITTKNLSIAIDISQRANWEGHLVPHLDELPFQFIGRGEQNALKIMLALEQRANTADVVLIEEPENHLAFAAMNILLSRMNEKCDGKQLFVATHSAYVLNKLGLKNLILLSAGGAKAKLTDLSKDTQDYFSKLPGYDTLRLILAKRTILVEGPSDELIVQKAYKDKHNKLPIENGTDVMSVRGLSFLRFLEIAKELKIDVTVVTDNDGDCSKVDAKYEDYSNLPNIKICRSDDISTPTLEPALIKTNGLSTLNSLLSKQYSTDAELQTYMVNNKTDSALKLFEASSLSYPQYILDAISEE